MLRLCSEKCTLILLKNDVIQENQKSIYIYGFELFWSTLLCIVSILSWGALSGYWNSVVIFLLFFMPIRMAAGGYHAKSFEACFVLTNSIALLCVIASKWLWLVDELWISLLLWLSLFLSYIYIWKMAPINLGKYSADTNRIWRNRKYAHYIIIIELFLSFVIRIIANSYVLYTSMIATCAVALMIYAAKREEVK